MGSIVVLDELTINKIAAGEVIERPSSVIKEMVENSIDAGAKNIKVEVKNGGISYIRITDDGKGIEREDLELSFERHATSKIRKAEDLDEVKSMGFRGEALASIAAIAKVQMISKTQNAETGNKIVIEGGNIKEIEEIGAPVGTTITVEELFYNTPVRYKFLKKDYTETGYIEDVITRIALIHPEISFKLINGDKTIIQTTGDGNIKNVIYSIYGKTISQACLNVNYNFEGIQITGVVGKPEIARSNRSNQMFFVNKRYIRDRILSNATEKAFKGMIPIGKFGFVILNLEMSPSSVDVNVHPAKLEVRFQEEQKVFKAVYCAIQDTLLKAELIANSETPITGKIEKKAEKNEEEEEQSTKSSLSGLFRKIARNASENEKYDQGNVIESIFRDKNKESESSFNFVEETKVEETKTEADSEAFGSFKKEMPNMETPEEAYNDVSKIDAIREKYGLAPLGSTIKTREIKEQEKNEEPKTVNNEQEIKNTINEFLQMGQQLTAEQIREKISQIATNARASVSNENKIVENEENESVENIVEASEIDNVSNEDIGVEEEETKYETQRIETEQIKQAIENDKKIQANDSEEIQETKEINAENAEREGQSPADVLLSIIKEKNIQTDIPTTQITENTENSNKFDTMYAKIFGSETSAVKEKEKEEMQKTNANDIVKSNMSLFNEKENNTANYKLIGIAFKTYIILEIEDELYILDQHAAHERIMYEKVKKNYYSDEEKDSQLMLLPDIITLTHKEMEIARENMDKFERAGFVLEEFGDNTIKLTGVPNICLDLDTKELFLETLDEINTVARTAKQEIEERFIATIACKAAVKANMALTDEEVASLLDELLKLPNPFTCPHGRPTAIKLSKTDIEKKFARRK